MKTAEPRTFILQGLDPVTRTPFVECRVIITDIAALKTIFDPESDEDPNLTSTYHVEQTDLIAIGRICEPAFLPDSSFTALTPWHSIRDAPYLVHTNFELPLMLEKRKPMAMFCDHRAQWLQNYLAPFAPFVASGQLVCREIQLPASGVGQPTSSSDGPLFVYFALPGEEWRIDAHMMLRRVAENSGWNDALERFEGSLLGYEDWQNDWWIAQRQKRRA